MTLALRGVGDIRDRSDATLWMCAAWPFSSMEMCKIPTPAEIAADPSNAGGHLSAEAQAQAEELARQAIAADIAAHPENAGELCPPGWAPDPASNSLCSPCPQGTTPSNGVCVTTPPSTTLMFLIAAGLIVFSLVKK